MFIPILIQYEKSGESKDTVTSYVTSCTDFRLPTDMSAVCLYTVGWSRYLPASCRQSPDAGDHAGDLSNYSL